MAKQTTRRVAKSRAGTGLLDAVARNISGTAFFA